MNISFRMALIASITIFIGLVSNISAETDADEGDMLLTLARKNMEYGDNTMAVLNASRAMKTSTLQSEAVSILFEAGYLTGDYEKLLDARKEILRSSNEDPDLYVARAFLRLNRLDEALLSIDKAIRYGGRTIRLLSVKAAIFYRKGEIQEGDYILGSVVDSNSAAWQGLEARAERAFATGDKDRSCRLLHEAWGIAPEAWKGEFEKRIAELCPSSQYLAEMRRRRLGRDFEGARYTLTSGPESGAGDSFVEFYMAKPYEADDSDHFPDIYMEEAVEQEVPFIPKRDLWKGITSVRVALSSGHHDFRIKDGNTTVNLTVETKTGMVTPVRIFHFLLSKNSLANGNLLQTNTERIIGYRLNEPVYVSPADRNQITEMVSQMASLDWGARWYTLKSLEPLLSSNPEMQTTVLDRAKSDPHAYVRGLAGSLNERKDRSSPGFSGSPGFYLPRHEKYISVLLPKINLAGDFDGKSVYVSSSKSIPVPKLSPAVGIGASFGGKYRLGSGGWNAVSAEVYYEQANLEAKWLSYSGNAILMEWGFDFSWHLFADRRIQPFVSFALGFPSLSYSPGAVPLPGVGAVKLQGSKYAYGGGISFYLTQYVSLDMLLQKRSYDFSSAGSNGDIDLTPPLRADSLDPEARISLNF